MKMKNKLNNEKYINLLKSRKSSTLGSKGRQTFLLGKEKNSGTKKIAW